MSPYSRYWCLAALLAVGAAADEQGDKMKGIGMPILFIFLLAVVIVVTRSLLFDAVQAARNNPTIAFPFISAAVTALMSIFLYFSAGYGYGLVATIFAYINMCLSNGNRLRQYATPLTGIMLIWFGILVGIPSGLSSGIIVEVSSTNCKNFYPDYSDSMCKDGWIVYLLICSCILIGLTFMSLLSIVNVAINEETPSYARVGGSDGMVNSSANTAAVPLRQNEYVPPTADYSKMNPA
mmetsp:Transcript_68460/g.79752  ORF Transcript_68460/g.79752 Transcript_68460/m.79752 type:complete len:237 (-) Transcript_68460:209-919(-)|eukprot:CAMPEP_0176428414 /NCGR_PEP_ID=MMETSP0127-20121128/13136_1 /TAXON_ID=938130 /ORGANISM="Platyophrya macrostoma, Strain WH" /LENGTH=236 /DNA_ID=CAMNT_0017810093 /DNA_START=46 /DNA_END=756 /DNA_ORIENTATION=+